MVYAFLRRFPASKNLTLQQNGVIGYAVAKGMEIDREVVEHSSRNRPVEERKQFEEFLHSVGIGDQLIVDEIWALSDRIDELVKILSCIISRKIVLHIVTQSIVITKETPIGSLFPILNRVREESREKSSGVGRPKGSKSRSKFDSLQPKILQLLKEGERVSTIARILNVSRSSLKDYIESRSLKELADSSFVEISQSIRTDIIGDNELICPFEQQSKQGVH